MNAKINRKITAFYQKCYAVRRIERLIKNSNINNYSAYSMGFFNCLGEIIEAGIQERDKELNSLDMKISVSGIGYLPLLERLHWEWKYLAKMIEGTKKQKS